MSNQKEQKNSKNEPKVAKNSQKYPKDAKSIVDPFCFFFSTFGYFWLLNVTKSNQKKPKVAKRSQR